MAIAYDGSTDSYRRQNSAGIPSFPHTIMGWFKIGTDRNDYSAFLNFRSTSVIAWYCGTSSSGTRLIFYNGGDQLGTDLSVGVWYHVAVTSESGTNGARKVYLDGVLDIDTIGNEPDANDLWIGNSQSNEWLNGSMAAVKVFTGIFTAAEIAVERAQYLPYRKSDLWACWPLLSTIDGEQDRSGFGRSLLKSSSPIDAADGPPIGWGAEYNYMVVGGAGGGGGGGGAARNQVIIIG